jgi:beta-glucanase (GH16 family)
MRIITPALAACALIAALIDPATATSTASNPHPAATVAADAKPWQCGLPLRKPDGSAWTCRFVDHFSGTRLNTASWTVQKSSNSAAAPALACWEDDPENVRVSGGSLHLTVRKKSAPFLCQSPWGDFTTQYTGGSISTWDKLEMTYGRYEIRAKFPTATVAGIHSALWLYPREMTYGPWPRSGEIDIAEYFTKYPDRAIPNIHYNDAGLDPSTNNQCYIRNPRMFHTYTVEWTPGLITIDYDRKRCLTHRIKAASLTGSAPFDKPFFLVLTQTLGIGQNPFNASTTPLPQTMEVDRVRVWK